MAKKPTHQGTPEASLHCIKCGSDTMILFGQQIGEARLCSGCIQKGYFLQLYCDNLSGCKERHQVLVQRRIGG